MLPIVQFLALFICLLLKESFADVHYHHPFVFVTQACGAIRDSFSHYDALLLLFVNPMTVASHRFLLATSGAFVYSLCLFFYVFLCYIVICVVGAYASHVAYANLHRYNRGSLFRQSFHVARCYCRDLWEGNLKPLHVLRHSGPSNDLEQNL